MRLARVIGTVEATVKHPELVGAKLLLIDIVDDQGGILDAGHVAVDTCGAGKGDLVLVTFNTAARIPNQVAGAPVDATVVAFIDRVDTN